jgi:hypothetical protein
MKNILTAVVMLASTLAFAEDPPSDPLNKPVTWSGPERPGLAEFSSSLIQDWPAESRRAAEDTIARYGNPHEMTSQTLTWRNVGPFKRTTILRDVVDHQFPVPHKDVIEHVIDYKVPAGKAADLMQVDGSLIVNRTAGELAARSDSEAHNIAMLNAADAVVKHNYSVRKARDLLTRLVPRASQPELTEKLQFAIETAPTGDPDRPAPRMGR